MDLAKSINTESQEVVRIAALTAEACTDRIMKNVSWLSKIVLRPNSFTEI